MLLHWPVLLEYHLMMMAELRPLMGCLPGCCRVAEEIQIFTSLFSFIGWYAAFVEKREGAWRCRKEKDESVMCIVFSFTTLHLYFPS